MNGITYDQYYPGGCFKQLADAAGVIVTNNQYAPGGPVEQLRVMINPALVLDQHALGGCWAQAEAVVEGSSGGGGYVAEAVHFDGDTYLTIDSGVSSDSTLISFSLWITLPNLPDVDLPAGEWLLFDFDPPGRENGLHIQAHVDHPGSLKSIWSIAGGHTTLTGGVGANDGAITVGVWHHIFGYVDTATANVLYVDGVDVSGNTTIGDGFTLPFSTKGWAIPDSTDDWEPPFFIGDYADVWIAPGVLHTDVTTFRDAVTGKPKDPSDFPASAILLSGDAGGFVTNQGTGGDFTLTGTLSNASTSPSDD